MPRFSNRILFLLFILIGLFIFGFIVYRAMYLSITFDEVGTSDVLQGSYYDVLFAKRFFQSANNHILNSLLLKLSASCFGTSELALRLPNVLSYLFYAAASCLIAWKISANNWIRLTCFLLLNTNLYVLDFFSLARGYGLANSFELSSIAMMIVYLDNERPRAVLLSFLFAALAVYANFTWLNYYMALWFVFNIILFIKAPSFPNYLLGAFKRNLIPLIFIVILGALSFVPISYLRQQDEFRWGATNWFDSLHTFISNGLYDSDSSTIYIVQFILFGLVLSSLAMLITSIYKRKLSVIYQMLLFILATILVVLLETWIQYKLLHTMYIDGRKACLYYSLVTLLLVLFIEIALPQKGWPGILLPILLIGISGYHFYERVTPKAVREWWFEENSKEVAYYVNAHPLHGNRNLAVSWFFSESIRYYNEHVFNHAIQKLVKLDDIVEPGEFAYYYVIGDDARKVSPIYRPLFRFDWDRILFVKDSSAFEEDRKAMRLKINQGIIKINQDLNTVADSILLDQRKKMDWSRIPITRQEIK